jgi:hypothetical protein
VISPDEKLSQYPWEDWEGDLDYWFALGPLPRQDPTPIAEYFRHLRADQPRREENCARLWAALLFLETNLPALLAARAARRDAEGRAVLPTFLKSALYRAFMSFETDALLRVVDLPLVLRLAKEQREWNEDWKA